MASNIRQAPGVGLPLTVTSRRQTRAAIVVRAAADDSDGGAPAYTATPTLWPLYDAAMAATAAAKAAAAAGGDTAADQNGKADGRAWHTQVCCSPRHGTGCRATPQQNEGSTRVSMT